MINGARMDSWIRIASEDGTKVPLCAFEAEAPKATFLMLPALGVKARFYRHLGKALAERGITCFLFEQRGHGESPERAGRGKTFGLKAYLENDLMAAINYLKRETPNTPLYLAGHSMGGHLAAVMAGRDAGVKGVVQLACGFPYHGFFGARQARQIKFLSRMLPLVTLLFGYYPGDRFGFGGREYRRLMLDWRDWALGGTYDCPAMPAAETEIASFKGRVLSIAFEKDHFASDEAIAYSHSRFKGAGVTAVMLGEAEQGTHLGHFDWAKKPDGAVQAIVNWLA